MSRVLHTAQAMVSLAALITASGPVAAAGAGVAGLLSWRAIRTMPPAAPDLAEALAQDMQDELETRGVPADQHGLIAEMIAATLPEPSTLIDAGLHPDRVLEQMEARLQGTEQRNLDSLHLFQIVLRPRLQKLLTDPEFTKTLAPAFMAGVIERLDGLDATTRATRLGVLRVEAKMDLLPGQFAELLQNLNRASRDQLEALAARFEIAGVYDLSDAALREKLDKRAEDWRALRREIAAIPETMKQLSNLKGAAQAAFDAGRFEEVEMLLERVHQVELEEAAKTAELRAETALLRGRVDQAFTLLSSAADSLRPIDPLEPARRRIRYEDKLYQHGLRYGSNGMALSEKMLRSALAMIERDAAPLLWASAQNSLAIALQEQGNRTGGPEGAARLRQAVAAYSKALEVRTRADHPVDWAMTQNNLGEAFRAQGSRTGGPEGAALLGQAVEAYSKALEVRTRADHPVDWAMTQNNLGNALSQQGSRTGGPEGAALLGQAVAAFRAALEVRTRADHPAGWAMTQNNLGNALSDQGERTGGPEGAALLGQAVDAYRAAQQVYTRADHPVQWAITQNNIGTALADQGTRTGGPEGAALLGQAVAAYREALEVRTRADHPVDWAMTQQNMAIAEKALAEHNTCPDPAPHLRAALAHVEAALEVYDPVHMPYDYGTATSLRDQLRKALEEGA